MQEIKKMEVERFKKIRKNPIVCMLLIALMLSSCVVIKSVAADPVGYQNITVQEAKNLISNDSHVFILDVRNQSEYNLGHLYGATLLPLYEIQDWNWNITSGQPSLNLLQAHINDTVLVYCKAGSRSAPACQLLVEHGYTNVYNMEDGIVGWMQADFPLNTRYHHIQAESLSEIDIEPLLLYQTECITCQNQSTCSMADALPANSNFTVVEQNATHTILSIIGELNGTLTEYTVTLTLLSSYSTIEDGTNKTATMMSMAMTSTAFEQIYYALKYRAENDAYNFTVVSSLIPTDLQTYNASVSYISIDHNNASPGDVIKTQETIDTNSSVTLSEYYNILSKVSKELSKEYGDSEDYSIEQLESDYKSIKNELNSLSQIVEQQFADLDKSITEHSRTIIGVDLGIKDPNGVTNNGFESGLSGWTTGGNGYHCNGAEVYEGSYSLLLGRGDWNPPPGQDWAYQLVTLPEDAVNIVFGYYYRLYTYDIHSYDRLEIYVAKLGQDPVLFYDVGQYGTRGNYYVDGWMGVFHDYNMQTYAGSSFYIYFQVVNGDNTYPTWAYIDRVSVSYEEIYECSWESWLNCAWGDFDTATLCGWILDICDEAPSEYNPACAAGLICSLSYSLYCALEYCVIN